MGSSTRASIERLAKQDHALEQERGKEHYRVATLQASQIKERANPETRAPKPQLVLELLHSIATLGLIEPLAVDRRHRLLAGGHRLMALRMLSEPKEEARQRFEALNPTPDQSANFERILVDFEGQDPKEVPVHVFDFDSKIDPQRAFAIETAENTVRRDYTPREVLTLYKRMEEMEGYTATGGRPKAGERPIIPELSAVLGKSTSTVKRYLRQAAEEEEASREPQRAKHKKASKALKDLKRHLLRFEREAKGAEELAPLLALLGSETLAQALLEAEETFTELSDEKELGRLTQFSPQTEPFEPR